MCKVFVVEEHDETRDQIIDILAMAGHRVECAKSVTEAAKRYAETDTEILIIGFDIHNTEWANFIENAIPEQNAIKKIAILPKTPIDYFKRKSIKNHAAHLGVDVLLSRPIKEKKLLEAIHALY